MEGLNQFDFTIMEFIQNHFHNSVTDTLFIFFTYLGEAAFLWLGISLFLIISKRNRPCGVLIIAAIASTYLAGDIILKPIFSRSRPFLDYPDFIDLLIPAPSSFSFPSGHSATSFSAAVIIYHFYKKTGIAAFTAAGIIAFSRVLLFLHYPTDILAGSVFGGLIAWLILFLYKKKIKPFLEQKSGTIPAHNYQSKV